MNQKQSKVLVEAIKKLINSEVSRQVAAAKAEITKQVIAEIRRNANIPNQAQSIKRSNKSIQYSQNPLLNEILAATRPIEDESAYPEIRDKLGRPVNVVASDLEGRPVNLEKPAVQAVLEAMNKNYSDVIAPVQEKKAPVKSVSSIKQSAVNAMLTMDDDISNIRVPSPFDETDW